MATTTFTADYLGRDLINPSPGTSDATDYVGRDVQTGDVDYMGRDLTDNQPPDPPEPSVWQAETAYSTGDQVTLGGGEVLEATAGGTSGTTEPTPPGVGETVTDGTVTWQQLS